MRLQRALVMTSTLVVLCSACDSQSTLVQPRSFTRPGDLTFACLDTLSDEFVPMERCEGLPGDIEEASGAQHGLVVLVTQSGRGEVAAVDLRDNLVVDADVRVPGSTFVTVAEVPTGIAVLPSRPAVTYVASAAVQWIEPLPTHIFHPGATGPVPTADLTPVRLPGPPSGLLASPLETALYAPIPEAGVIARVPLDEAGTMGEVVELPVGTVVEPAPFDLASLDELPIHVRPGEYRKLCGSPTEPTIPPILPPRAVVDDGPAPRPVALVVDAMDGGDEQLFVADENRPVIHRVVAHIDGTVEELEPLPVGVPTRALALSPVVPASVGEGESFSSEPARYLYAVDATDQTILVVDVLDGSPTFGAVLPVSNQDGVADRIDFGTGVQALEVVTPALSSGVTCDPLNEATEPEEAGPVRLRGVFLAVGLANGIVAFLDIHDMDLPCRGGVQCAEPLPNADDQQVYIWRHRPRIGAVRRDEDPIVDLSGAPTFTFDSVPGSVTPDGAVEAGNAPGLEPLDECPMGTLKVFPFEETAPPLICALADVWSLAPEQWQAEWEGSIPDTAGGRGRFVSDDPEVFLAPNLSPCAAGVLGSADAPEADSLPQDVDPETVPELGYGGDVLVITSALPDGNESRSECERFAGEPEDRDEIGFRITRAGRALVGDGEAARLEGVLRLGAPVGIAGSLQDVASCFDELVGYEIRSADAYTVQGGASGFLHRVVLEGPGNGEGSCAVDLSQDGRSVGRATAGVAYHNPYVSFTIARASQDAAVPSGSTARLVFRFADIPPPLLLDLGNLSRQTRDIGVLPTALRFNTTDERLYAIDVGQRRMIQLAFDPLSTARAFQ